MGPQPKPGFHPICVLVNVLQVFHPDVEEAKHWIQKWENEEQLCTALVNATKKRDLAALNDVIPRAKQTSLRDLSE